MDERFHLDLSHDGGQPMRMTTAITLAAALVLHHGSLRAQDTAATGNWIGKSVALARVGGRAIAAACPERAQVHQLVRDGGRWEKSSIGCRHVTSGNFTAARVVEESGAYMRVTFTLTTGMRTLWVPRANFRLSS